LKPDELLNPEQRRPSKAYLVNELRKAVFTWRNEGYPRVTPTTKRLLQFWFGEEHIVDGEPFQFWFCQREAVETLIYVYEVMKKGNFIDMARDFGSGPIQGYDPSYDQYPLYAFKMATGSGKTFVMALTPLWPFRPHSIADPTRHLGSLPEIDYNQGVLMSSCNTWRSKSAFLPAQSHLRM